MPLVTCVVAGGIVLSVGRCSFASTASRQGALRMEKRYVDVEKRQAGWRASQDNKQQQTGACCGMRASGLWEQVSPAS